MPGPNEPQSLIDSPPTSSTTIAGADPNAGQITGEQSQDLISSPPEPSFDFAPIAQENFTGLLPEGLTLPEGLDARIIEITNSAQSRADLTKGFLTLYHEQDQKVAAEITTAYTEQIQAWQDEVKNDPEIGGAKLSGVLTQVKSFVQEYGGEPVFDMLKASGLGNNIHVIRMLHKAAQAMVKEAAPVQTTPTAAPRSIEDRLFPS